MKVLFAVNDEKSSAAIVKKYQKEYKEIISYKKVYYFNAILKELQRDKTYDRIVISEDLEEFSSTSYEQQDKYIFERLDNISDEASNAKGREVPIIVICSERRIKSEELLVKLTCEYSGKISWIGVNFTRPGFIISEPVDKKQIA